jgi:putative Ca2+/H+ antiporter (TMEM165/GDT1 family)
MDALLTTLFAAALSEMGDRSQLLCAVLAMRFADNRAVLAGLALATLCNCLLSAYFGGIINQWISQDPVQLLFALSLIAAGASMLAWRRKLDLLSGWRTGAFVTSFAGLFILQFGDKTQFIIGANAARTDMWPLAAAGGWIGIMIACVPAILWREQLAAMMPVTIIRRTGGVLLCVIGLVLALSAWRLFG